jgi:hypothetical protein
MRQYLAKFLLLLLVTVFLGGAPGRTLLGCVDGRPCSQMPVVAVHTCCQSMPGDQAPRLPPETRCVYQDHPSAPASMQRGVPAMPMLAQIHAPLLTILLVPVPVIRAFPTNDLPPYEPDPKQGRAARAPPVCA